ncbi:bacteriocin immunity protein [Vibrio campbellii]|uniref:Uncharacterized protein n=1 Tax=Vibrio campbellii TaxID=680 RepID=A0ABY5ILX2_9VIBR|nr:hypothetical protein HB760_26200 [Vibrio campbellii]UTZ35225.1 hypothetical protein HB762_28360 [Vibrio campbellii]
MNSWEDCFIDLVVHPKSRDLIFYPPDDRKDSPIGIVYENKMCRSEKELPCLKK